MSKWQKIDPDEIKVGDEVRWVMAITGGRVIREVAVSEIAAHGIRLGMTWAAQAQGTWYVRKPKKAKPPVRPDEPPVGSFFRVDRTGIIYWKCGVDISFRRPLPPYQQMIPPAPSPGAVKRWELITEPGDTITILKLVEDYPPATVHYPRPYGEDTQ